MSPAKEFAGLLIWILCVLPWISPERVLAQDVYVVAGGPDYSESVRFAAWSLSERTGMRFEYRGVLPAETGLCQHSGSIIFRTPSLNELIPDLQFAPDGPIARSLSCSAGENTSEQMFVVALNPHFPFGDSDNRAANLRMTALHELLHSATKVLGHLTDPLAVMYHGATKATSRHLLTTADALLALKERRWPQHNKPSLCHNELAPNWDLKIPELPTFPVRATQLAYVGRVDGYHTWEESVSARVNAEDRQRCTNNTWIGNAYKLTDIRSMDFGNYSSAILQPWNGRWRLLEAAR